MPIHREPIAVTRARNRLMRMIQGEFTDLEQGSEREALADWLVQYATNYADIVHGRDFHEGTPHAASAVCDNDSEPDMKPYIPDLD